MRRTPLFDKHVQLGGRVVDFHGWQLPVQYEGIIAEHDHCRSAACLFDTCHMGQFRVAGTSAGEALSRVCTQDAAGPAIGQCRYGFLLNGDGGIRDDTILMRLGESEFLLVVNAGPREADLAWVREKLGPSVAVEDRSETWGKIDLQGPASFTVLSEVFELDVSNLGYFHATAVASSNSGIRVPESGKAGGMATPVLRGHVGSEMSSEHQSPCRRLVNEKNQGGSPYRRLVNEKNQRRSPCRRPLNGGEASEIRNPESGTGLSHHQRRAGAPLLPEGTIISRTGYTGELGYEVFVPVGAVGEVWDALLAHSAVRPAGLGARDLLRLEMAYPLHGQDITERANPIEAGLEAFVDLSRDFIGRDALAAAAAAGPARKLVAFRTDTRRRADHGQTILAGGEPVGEVTSAGYSPSLGASIGMGYVAAAASAVGAKLTIDHPRRPLTAEVVGKPPYKGGTCRTREP